MSHWQQHVFYKISIGRQPYFDLYTGLVFPSRKSMIQPLGTTKAWFLSCMCSQDSVHTPWNMHVLHTPSPSMRAHPHTYKRKVSVLHFWSTRIEEKKKSLGDSFGTKRHAGHSIHHCKACNERDNNKTIQGEIKHKRLQITLWRCYMRKEMESAESAPTLVPEKPAWIH